MAGVPSAAHAQEASLPAYLSDRGTGIPTSQTGTYVRKGELLIYPFFEYALDNDREYRPDQFGVGPDVDFRGKYRASEFGLFIGYGVTEWLALELEASSLRARLDKSPSDTFPTPARTEESGLGDIEAQLRFRLMNESDRRPEIFGYVEVTAPSQKNKVLIGDPDWDFKPGLGVIKGFSWGTMTLRGTVEYNREESHVDLGEFSLEYLKRLSPSWRVYVGVEGGESGALDEWDLITGVQWRVSEVVALKLDNALGLQSKSNDWAPRIGIVFAFK
jgi:hypothetical protein